MNLRGYDENQSSLPGFHAASKGEGRRRLSQKIECAIMPYRINADLPLPVRNHLPPHAQDIFREAFNHAYAAHWNDPRREGAAHRIAWSAVKRSYEKVNGEWVPRGN